MRTGRGELEATQRARGARHQRQARARLVRAVALAERRRIARDLHDGLAQDLAIIAAHAPTLAAALGESDPVVAAARRALATTRSTISELSHPTGASLSDCLEAVAHELRERYDVAITVAVAPGVELDPAASEHVSRISREAIANAARHGGAGNVVVSLERRGAGVTLSVADDGFGILDRDGARAPEGFGIADMRARAAALGGSLNLRRSLRGGTELEVQIP